MIDEHRARDRVLGGPPPESVADSPKTRYVRHSAREAGCFTIKMLEFRGK